MDIVNLSTTILKAPVIASAVDISGLRSFMSGDAVYVIGVVAAAFAIKLFKDGSIVKMAGLLVFYVIIAALLKGTALLSWLSGILEWFGINTGF